MDHIREKDQTEEKEQPENDSWVEDKKQLEEESYTEDKEQCMSHYSGSRGR